MGTDGALDATVASVTTLDQAYLRRIGLSPPGPGATRPVYRHISRGIERSIGDGSLPPASKLPAERELARLLCVSRATVVKAYRDLESRGLVRGYVGRGTFVAAAPDASGAPFAWRGKVAATALRTTDSLMRDLISSSTDLELMSVAAGIPALECFPEQAFRTSIDRVLQRDARAVWGHGGTEGHSELREAIASRFGGAAENVLVLAGAQQGIDLLARCLLDPGDTVVIDRPGYLGAIHAFRAAGARLIGWDIVRHDLDELDDHIVRYRPKFIYTNPTFQNPTGWTMPARLRRDLLALAASRRVPIVEDDTYRELSMTSSPPPSLHSMDTQSIVINLNSFSKMLAPGLRLGWLVAAEPIVEQLAIVKQRADPHTPNLVQLVVKELIEDGTFDRHLAHLRAEHRRRRDAVLAALRRHQAETMLTWTEAEGGLYLWCRLRPRVNAATVLKRALAESVSFVHGQAFYVDHAGERELRLCFSSIPVAHADDVAERLVRSILTVRRETSGQPPLVAIV
jgi:DNA-binding transcriptional MocR family regulator